ncbi:MAG: zinc transporter ZntB [Gammaproteobacteria bacterium]|nr:zinc transporter ZntB [Pseudomonadales bacterium]MCP5346528.1 zinc transporter ZntB [Pseudomonadales bacterium]
MVKAPDGLIHAKLLDGQGGARDLDWHEVENWNPAMGTRWLHFDFCREEAQQWLIRDSGLNDIASTALITPETRPRAINRGDNMLLALRGVNLNPGSEPDDMVSVRIWTDGRQLISTRKRILQSTQDLLEDLKAGVGPTDAPSLLIQWVDRITQRMSGTVDNLEEEVDYLEERVVAGEVKSVRLDLAGLRKQCITLRRYLAPQREAMNRLAAEPVSWLDEMDRLRLREINDRLIRHIEDIDAVRERAAAAHDELLTQMSEEMNRRSYVFTVVATIFLPLGFFTGLMGINVGGMPGVEDDTAFWIVVVLCVGLMSALAMLFRWNRWL